MSTTINAKTEDIMKNININPDLPADGNMLEMDETYVE